VNPQAPDVHDWTGDEAVFVMRDRIFARTPPRVVAGSGSDHEDWGPAADPGYSAQWVAAHRAHVKPGARSAFGAFRDSLWGPWRVWCSCGASFETSRASCELICLVARRSVLRMDVDECRVKTGDQTAAIG
jgi:hypothetical protein